jgi:hypothetical protein
LLKPGRWLQGSHDRLRRDVTAWCIDDGAGARDYMLETGTVMVLTDADGIVLRLEGDTKLKVPLYFSVVEDGTQSLILPPVGLPAIKPAATDKFAAGETAHKQ